MIEKDKIIEELGAINNLKQSEIQKLDELVKNFEELFGHYQEEVRDLWLNLFAGKQKNQLNAENEKINEELRKFNALLQNIDEHDEQGEQQENGEGEEQEGEPEKQ